MEHTVVIYGVATCVYGAAWQFVVAYMMGLVVAADASGRLPVLNAAALGTGGALGPGLVGMLSEDGSFTAAFLLIGSVALVSAGLAVSIDRAVRARRARA